MSSRIAVLFGAVLLLGGCHAGVSNDSDPSHPSEWEELHLSYARRLQKWRWRESMTVDQPPDNAIRITASVVGVSVPFPPPASDSGETATVTFSFPAGQIPPYPKVGWVVMRYDPHVNPFMEGASHVIVFMPDGRFWGGTSFHF